jgi:hypothetical protein
MAPSGRRHWRNFSTANDDAFVAASADDGLQAMIDPKGRGRFDGS